MHRSRRHAPKPTRRPLVRGLVRGVNALLLLSAAGCTGSESARTTPIEELPELVFEEELRLGSVDDPDLGFTRIGDVWVSPAGELWVTERGALEIRVFDSDGRLLRTYGREGDGPGEFRSIGWFGLVGDTLWVSDGSLRRTTLFSMDGTVLATVTARVEVPIGDFMGFPASVNVFPNALRADGLIESIFVSTIRPNLSDSVVQVPRLLFDLQGEIVDTLEMVETRVSRSAEIVEYGNGSSSAIYHEPPAFDSGTAVMEIDAGTYALHWSALDGPGQGRLVASLVAPEGDTTFLRRIQYDPKPVTAAYLDSLAARRTRPRLGRRDSLRLFNTARAALQRPDHHRPVRAPMEVGQGTLWARLDPDDPSSNRWLVFLEADRAIGTVSLPQGAFPMWGTATNIWVRESDEFDVPWLVRYRIGAPAPAG